jgi:integrase
MPIDGLLSQDETAGSRRHARPESPRFCRVNGFDFGFLNDTPLDRITVEQIEQWRSKRKKVGLKSSSVNRRTMALKATVNWAAKRGLIENNPLAKLERLSEGDSGNKVRCLTDDERKRLLAALDAGEQDIRNGRDSHIKWAKGRGLAPAPAMKDSEFADHLKPIILLSLSTDDTQIRSSCPGKQAPGGKTAGFKIRRDRIYFFTRSKKGRCSHRLFRHMFLSPLPLLLVSPDMTDSPHGYRVVFDALSISRRPQTAELARSSLMRTAAETRYLFRTTSAVLTGIPIHGLSPPRN